MATEISGQMTIFDILAGAPFDDNKAHWSVSGGRERARNIPEETELTYVMAIPPTEILTARNRADWFENHRSYWYAHVMAVYQALSWHRCWTDAIDVLHKHCDDQAPVKMCVLRDSVEVLQVNVVEYLAR